MRIYLDMCCFNRPYDDQTQGRIRLETEAKVLLQQKIKNAQCDLVWSATLDFECGNNPYEEHRHAIHQWRNLAVSIVVADATVVSNAIDLAKHGLGHYDALHIASAKAGKADLFVTTDDRLIKKVRALADLTVMLPGEALAFLENWYEN
jgi:predicted nucleic acid-binding protein